LPNFVKKQKKPFWENASYITGCVLLTGGRALPCLATAVSRTQAVIYGAFYLKPLIFIPYTQNKLKISIL
jgi:hypothetical protein